MPELQDNAASSVPANKLVEAALAYALRGWPVIPLHTPIATGGCSCGRTDCGCGKHPRTRHGLDEATTNATRIRSWWRLWPDANVGILCGAESGLVVLDVDADHDGETALAALESQFGAIPQTIESLTGGGGRHIFFSHPGPSVRNAVALGGHAGLDLRGDGGYVVGPPSRHQSGRDYAWDASHHPDDVQLAPLPDWIITLLQTGTAPGGNGYKSAGVIGARIPTGQRNQTLTSIAGTMRRRGLPEAAILAALLTVNADQCDPPLPPDEVQVIAASVASYQPAPSAPPIPALHAAAAGHTFNLTDTGNAERLIARYGKNLRYCYPAGKWYVWDGKCWCPDDGGRVDYYAKLTVRSIYAEAARTTDDAARKALADHARRSEAAGRMRAMVDLARSEPGVAVRPQEMDANPWLLNCQNGTLNLIDGQLLPHRQSDLQTKIVTVDYDPAATCPTWIAFLDRILQSKQQLIAFLQRAAGYALTGTTMEQCLFMLYGTGSNGKSTMLGTLRALLNGYAQQAAFDTFLHKERDSVSNDIAALAGVRLVVASEVNEGRRLSEAVVKQLTGQDPVRARYLFQESFEFIPQLKLWLGLNHKPIIRDPTHGMWRRLHLIPFTVKIPDDEMDKSLPDQLKAESSGILTWAVQGCLEWQRVGLGVPDEVRAATAKYGEEMDILADFLHECCVLSSGARATAKDLYAAYKLWAVDNSMQPVNQTIFGRRLADRGLVNKRIMGYVHWFGIGLQGGPIQPEMEGLVDGLGGLVDNSGPFPISPREGLLEPELMEKTGVNRLLSTNSPLSPKGKKGQNEAGVAAPEATGEGDKASVELMRAALRLKGLVDDEIDRLTAKQAWEILGAAYEQGKGG